ncbi:AAA family ATPase [Burkholderiaceae bacterium DAT-1]|nr:AAA family ATPase [Burkholderiaceae bacterium DAT-1]
MDCPAGFTVLDTLYRSNCTLVYRARRDLDQLPVILKILNDDFPKAQDIIRYKREFDITRNWDHPRLIRSLELHYVNNKPVIVFEDIGGESLAALSSHHRWTLTEQIRVAGMIAEGLAEVHARKVIHKDINPANVIYDPASGALKLIDFGIASVLTREEPSIRPPSGLEGTLPYMSPEQTGRMNRAVDYRSDFYSFGITLYELLTGMPPFEGDDALALVHQHLTKQARPLNELLVDIPPALARIVAKLMEKTAEARYQSAWGIHADLQRCLAAIKGGDLAADFEPGGCDQPEQFVLPERRYGREIATGHLLDAFKAVTDGARELVLMAGYSGIGKTSLVHELYAPATAHRAWVISGKFDQFQLHTPYAALLSAFRDLVRQLLAESESSLQHWRDAMHAALGKNAQVIVDTIPELQTIIGPQPAVEVLAPRESRNRFTLAFLAFIRVFCQPTHPLVIFLDDLQWADHATLSLIEALMLDDSLHHLLLVSAYRDNEVADDHPLISRLDKLAAQGVSIRQIHLKPLKTVHIGQLICDTLHCTTETALPLAQLVEEKTGGNPFFVRQFLTELYQQGLLSHGVRHTGQAPEWYWEMAAVSKADITSNVIDLLVDTLGRLPEDTRTALPIAACIGNRFDLDCLAAVQACDRAQVFDRLRPALSAGLIRPLSALTLSDVTDPRSAMVHECMQFSHDRIQQAAASLLSQSGLCAVHLTIGQIRAARPDAWTDGLFDVVGHLNIGMSCMHAPDARIQLARFNLEAAIRAKQAAAFSAALDYVRAAVEAVGEHWDTAYELTLAMAEQGAELHYLNGDYDTAEQILASIRTHGRTQDDQARACVQLVTQRTMQGRYLDAIEAAAEALSLYEVSFPQGSDVQSALEAELAEVSRLQGERAVTELLALPPMQTPAIIMQMRILMTVHTTIYFTGNYPLYSWVLARMVALSIAHGNLPESAKGYASFGNTIAANLADYQRGYDFGVLGVRLAEHYRNQSLKCKTNLILSMFLNHWCRPMREADVFDEEGSQAGMEAGELQFVGYILFYGKTLNRFCRGDYLGALLSDLGGHLKFARKAKHSLTQDNLLAASRIIHGLMGQREEPGYYDADTVPDDATFIQSCEQHRSYSAIAFFHLASAFQAWMMRDWRRAESSLDAARSLADYVRGTACEAAGVWFEALVVASRLELEPQSDALRARLGAAQARIAVWAHHAPDTFAHQHSLLNGVAHCLAGQDFAAMQAFDQAIEQARQAGFKQNEAICHEFAGRFWVQQGKEAFAMHHLECAMRGYHAWGAYAKENILALAFPTLQSRQAEPRSLPGSTRHLATRHATILAQSARLAGNHLDLAAVIKASQAISGEIDLDSVLDKLLHALMEGAGAHFGAVILHRDEQLTLVAQMDTTRELQARRVNIPLEASAALSHTIVKFVARSGESVILGDASREGMFTADPYVREHQCKSLLCMPIRNGGQLLGILYMENARMSGAFPSSRMGLLNILAAQAAISIQNAWLYRDLKDEVAQHRKVVEELKVAEEQYRTVFDNAADGIFRVAGDGRLILANPALAHMLGFPSPVHMMSYAAQSGVNQFLGTELRSQLIERFKREGSIRNVEFKTERFDGASVELSLTGHVSFDEAGQVRYYEGVIQDVTARRRVMELKIAKEAAEATAKAKGEFLANMSHEIRTPMTAILGFAGIALKQSLTPKVRDYLQKIDAAGQSLLSVINDILDFSKMDAGKLELERIPFDLHALLGRQRDLFIEQAVNKGIQLSVESDARVPGVLVGDPTRLGQILTNLMGNAIKFTARGEVSLRVELNALNDSTASLSFMVRDSGIGMSKQQLSKLFHAFYQADGSTTRHFGGTGLGLTISKNLVRLMQGDIAVHSEPGQGTTFIVTLPFPVLASMPEPDSHAQPVSEQSGRNRRVLLVEDNLVNQEVGTELLREVGYIVQRAANGREAVALAEREQFDAILMDIQMPEMDGYQATKLIREGTFQPNVPIIAMTAHAIAGYRDQCLAGGMNDYLTKPIVPADLYSVLEKWCVVAVSAVADSVPATQSTTVPEGKEAFAALAPLIDIDLAWHHVGGKAGLLRRLLERFVVSMEANDVQLKAAMAAQDRETAHRIAHTVKGMAGTLGAERLRDVAEQLEQQLIAGGVTVGSDAANAFHEVSVQLKEHVKGYISA